MINGNRNQALHPHNLPRSAWLAVFVTACLILSACAPGNPGFSELLPPALNSDWQRGEPRTGPADQTLFGGGISTSAEYRNGAQLCVITITGDAPMMQGLSMNFSNPAAAGLTGARVEYFGDEPLVITADGEIQVLTRNYLTQITGNCSKEDKLAYLTITDFASLREFVLAGAGSSDSSPHDAANGVAWEAAFGGADKDWAYAMTGTRDGGLCTAGRTASQGAGLEDVWLVRLDGDGNKLWDRSFGGPAIDRARAIIETRDQHLVVAGATESKGAGEFDVWVLKLDAGGELLWDRHFGGIATDWASAVVETGDGGLALGAYTQDEAGAAYDFWVIKLSTDGDLLWQRRYGGEATDWINAIAETSDGNLVVAGHTESIGAGKADLWVLKLTADGEPLWDRSFGGAETDYASTVTATRDGGLLIGGMTRSTGAGGFDIRIIKLTADGEVVWQQTFGGEKDDWVRAVLETRDGGHALAGYTMSQGAGLYDVWLLKLDADGSLLWERTFGEAGNEWARALVEMPDGGLALAGDTYSRGAGASDVLVLRLSAEL